MRRLLAAAAAAVVLALTGACASSPTQHFKLSAVADPARAQAAADDQTRPSVAVGPVLVPALVDRPQMVFNTGTNQVRLDEFNRWAAPLADEITRVTMENLTQLLVTPDVWPAAADPVSRAELKLRIDVVDFQATPGESVLVDARWSVRRGSISRSGRSMLREPCSGPGADAVAAAYSRALATMAADIADAIRAP